MSSVSRRIGYLAQVACTWEVLARKPGNVCPGREFPDLTVDDFLTSAAAIAPILERAPNQELGFTIRSAIQATRHVVQTNTNLGIVLLLAPLTSVPPDRPLMPDLVDILARTGVEDTRNVYAAIRLAKPGGLGKVSEQDVHEEPTVPLLTAMAMARHRDLIADQYATRFELVRNLIARLLATCVKQYQNVERAIIETQLYMLFRDGDDLIRRKGGEWDSVRSRARKIREHGLDTSEGRHAFLEFDAYLRDENHTRNPGTTADLIAAGLFVALRENLISLTTPFVWEDHPFAQWM